jgi:uncharacterized protein DUF4350
MKLLASLTDKDRQMLFITISLVLILLTLLALVSPSDDPNRNPVPSSYLSGQHGAKAAFNLLQQTGYTVERWEQPLSDLAEQAGPNSVLILAEPFSFERADHAAIVSILQKGGRVLATGGQGGLLLPGSEATRSKGISFAACEAQPDGLSSLAGGGPIWIVPSFTWPESRPEIRTAYTCAGQPVVVEYLVGPGKVVWWASSMPLENGSITRGQNLELLLNSIGPVQSKHIYWDESLHGAVQSQWDLAEGPIWPLLSLGSLGLALLAIFSFSRRSGPIRLLPQASRTTPIEFLEALGALYRSTGAATTAMQIAWERFRSQSALLTGQRTSHLNASQLAAAIERRFGSAVAGMEAELVAAEEACWDDNLKPRRALTLIQALRRHEEIMRIASSHRASGAPANLRATLGT